MMARPVRDSRLRAYGEFLAALFYYFLARALARHGSLGLFSGGWQPLVEQAMLVFLLVLGYAGMGYFLNRQQHPIAAQGLPAREGWIQEGGLGLAIGWGAALVCVIAMAIGGGIAERVTLAPSAWGWLLVNAVLFALGTLAEEIAFRGYAFQRFARAVGSPGAVLGFSVLYAFMQALQVGSSRASIAVSFVLCVVLSTAYLRTRALWVSWGLNFGWKATRALVFGLAVSGDSSHSPVVQGDPMGPFWLTGGGFGLEGSWLAFLVLLVLVLVVYSATRELDYRYNAPVIVPGGIPVDLDAAQQRQHEAAMGKEAVPAEPVLVQILPVQGTFTGLGTDLGTGSTTGRPLPLKEAEPKPEAGNESVQG